MPSTRLREPFPARSTERAVTERAAWRAVLTRDVWLDGRFVYGVASTGVYCRPSCPSRRPARRHVAFFTSAIKARRAGYRACRRCEPDDPRPVLSMRRVERAIAYLAEHPDKRVTLAALGERVGLSAFHLQRTFRQLTGLSPKEYATMLRMERLKTQLRKGTSVTEAIYGAGYGSGSRVYEHAHAALGMTPGAYRRKGQGMDIQYWVVPTRFGRVLIGATKRGVCYVSLGDETQTLEAALKREYPNATIERAADLPHRWTKAVLRLVDGDRVPMPLDVPGTTFQWKVWKALQRIPYGGTRTYSEVAESIGQPSAARAVARACATNPVSLVVPCHRVVRADGMLGGYAWGLDRKRQLIEHEANRVQKRP